MGLPTVHDRCVDRRADVGRLMLSCCLLSDDTKTESGTTFPAIITTCCFPVAVCADRCYYVLFPCRSLSSPRFPCRRYVDCAVSARSVHLGFVSRCSRGSGRVWYN